MLGGTRCANCTSAAVCHNLVKCLVTSTPPLPHPHLSQFPKDILLISTLPFAQAIDAAEMDSVCQRLSDPRRVVLPQKKSIPMAYPVPEKPETMTTPASVVQTNEMNQELSSGAPKDRSMADVEIIKKVMNSTYYPAVVVYP